MASQSDTLEEDAKRMKSRSFAGYLKDRFTGSADFKKARTAQELKADTPFHVGDKEKNPEAYKKGGSVRGWGKASKGKKARYF